ncbi:MAG: hypothetical protein ACLFVJ_17740 [Persicimonas sp.]
MMPKMQRILAVSLLFVVTLSAVPAEAADNDLVLSRFGQCVTEVPDESPCQSVDKDTEGFRSLARDVGQIFAPRFLNPAETLGEAGFAVNLMTSLSFIPNDEDYWQTAIEDEAPGDAMFTAHLQVRKGLPFSFEISGDMAYLYASEMFALGSHLKWALNEGFYYFPDIAVRGSVNTIMGAEELNLINAGWDISMSKAFNISGVLSLAPYAGYQQLHVIASSRLLNAYPQDPRPPQFADDRADSDQDFSPEFVFSQEHETINRFFAGARLNVWMLAFTLEGTYADDVTQATLSAGVDF